MRFPRFYPILDTELLEARGLAVTEAARVMIDAGISILQLRHKGPYSRDVFQNAEILARMCRDAGALFIVNDRADIARLLEAGLHVGQEDLTPSDARRVIGPLRRLGLSTHTEEQVRAAIQEPADYLAFGPVFPTWSKRNPDPVAGLDRLRSIRALVEMPLIAIGGITRERAPEVFSSGADSVAVIGDLYPDPLDAAALNRRVREWLAATAGPASLA